MSNVNYPVQLQQQIPPQYQQPIQQPVTSVYSQIDQHYVTQAMTIPPHVRRSAFGLAIALLILGIISIIFGGISFIFSRSFVTLIGANIWVGLIYTIAGSLAIAHHQVPTNVSLLHSFYAFSIIAFIFSLPHFGISVASLVYSYYVFIPSGIISTCLSISGFSLTLAFIVILSKYIYCVNPGATVPGRVYTNFTSDPVQPAGMPYVASQQIPANPIQQTQVGSPVIYPGGTTMPSTAIMNPQSTTMTSEKGKALNYFPR
ncbi:uncharacterized protein TRIADDRAFT_56020 [Trichoplax adhaerens]|uniref:Uncharacterized protein n=1 Tax=Trichoplax adhaerens TaxID=10228 RepID=B3RTR6_TRIAD|nr:predicted protein [Trichoplax adhaerens]EDV26181.1 predicted protein [Trichoplax adhaerens]|eukprot:XP_002112214.1 predicted protein [Trichoplax adhaerens]